MPPPGCGGVAVTDWRRVMRAGYSEAKVAGSVYVVAMFVILFAWLIATGAVPANLADTVAWSVPLFLAAVFVVGAGDEWLVIRRQEAA